MTRWGQAFDCKLQSIYANVAYLEKDTDLSQGWISHAVASRLLETSKLNRDGSEGISR